MSSGSLIDLDPPPARERRWPFYIGWAVGGVMVGAVMLSHLPVSLGHPAAVQVTEPSVTAPPRLLPPQATPFRIAPVPIAPVRP